MSAAWRLFNVARQTQLIKEHANIISNRYDTTYNFDKFNPACSFWCCLSRQQLPFKVPAELLIGNGRLCSVQQFYTAVAQTPSASFPSNAWQWSLGGASRCMGVTLVGRRSNSTKHSLRLVGHQHIAHHTHRVVLYQLLGAQPAKSTHNARFYLGDNDVAILHLLYW